MNNSFEVEIEVRTATPALAWETDLASRLSALGGAIRLVRGLTVAAVPGLDLLRKLERMVIRNRPVGAGAAEPVPAGAIPAPGPAARQPDMIVDLACEALGTPRVPTLVPLFDGRPGRRTAIDAILSQQNPTIAIAYASPSAPEWRIVATARPAFDRPWYFTPSIDTLFEKTRGVLEQVIARLTGQGGLDETLLGAAALPTKVRRRSTSPPAFLSSLLARKVAERLTQVGQRHERWTIGLRPLGTSVRETHAWPGDAYTAVPDDPSRCFADPFLLEREGRVWLFCEEIACATEWGTLAVTEVRPDGSCDMPRTFLEAPYHLSYPNVFERDGQVWMIPETGSAGRIELWRCERFPDRFVHHAVLVPDVVAADATLFEHGGKLWLSACVGEGGSTWDTLCLWSADRLEGPWHPHPANPVLVDATCARPAGAPWRDGGTLWRPTQDCSSGYGAGVVLCRVDRLDMEAFVQTPVTRLGPRPEWPRAIGTHTLNVGGGFEAVDWHGPG